mmetsp:Transcript_27814/g.67671  ORF Transcript_27814/g.67671 Transcript_27814/m.67671 type:complete len:167 (+) Transcript_27814:82-582(+)
MTSRSPSSNKNRPVSPHQEDGDSSSSTNLLRLDKLPQDAMSQVLVHCCSDFSTIRSLANASQVFQATIYNQDWKCHCCSDPLFVGSDLETNKHAQPFICAVCHKKLCGESIDYDRRHCRPQKCDGCGKIECYHCQQAHMQDSSDGYGTENYCEECQAEFEFGMGGC